LDPHGSAIQKRPPTSQLRLSATITESPTLTTRSLDFRQRVLDTNMWSRSITSRQLIMRPLRPAMFSYAIVMRTGLRWMLKPMGGILKLFRLVILEIRLNYNIIFPYSRTPWRSSHLENSRVFKTFCNHSSNCLRMLLVSSAMLFKFLILHRYCKQKMIILARTERNKCMEVINLQSIAF
jgi:hypothetical protein